MLQLASEGLQLSWAADGCGEAMVGADVYAMGATVEARLTAIGSRVMLAESICDDKDGLTVAVGAGGGGDSCDM